MGQSAIASGDITGKGILKHEACMSIATTGMLNPPSQCINIYRSEPGHKLLYYTFPKADRDILGSYPATANIELLDSITDHSYIDFNMGVSHKGFDSGSGFDTYDIQSVNSVTVKGTKDTTSVILDSFNKTDNRIYGTYSLNGYADKICVILDYEYSDGNYIKIPSQTAKRDVFCNTADTIKGGVFGVQNLSASTKYWLTILPYSNVEINGSQIAGSGVAGKEIITIGNYPKPSADVALSSKGAKTLAGTNPASIIDGNINNYSTTEGFTYHYNNNALIVELDQIYNINQLDLLLWDLDDRYYQYYVEVSQDNLNWDRVVDRTSGENRSWQYLDIGSNDVKYIKIVGTHNSVSSWFHVVELKAYNKTQSISPKPSADVALSSKGAITLSGTNPSSIIDGDIVNYDAKNGFTYAYNNNPIVIELDQVYNINQLDLLLWDLDDRYYQYYVEVSQDNQNWAKVVDRTSGENRSWQFLNIPDMDVKYIKIVGTNGSASSWFHVVEVKAYYQTTAPKATSDVALASKGAKIITTLNKYSKYLIDGNTFNYSNRDGFTVSSAAGKEPITIELDRIYTINNIDLLLWDLDDRYYQYFVEVSKDNQSWERVIDKTSGENRSWQNNYIGDKQVKYIRVVGTKNSIHYYLNVVELNAYYATNAPKPATDVALASAGAKVISQPNYPNFIIDGDSFNYNTGTGFTSAGFSIKQPITIELDKVYTINNVDLLLYDLDDRYYQYYIEVSKDNQNWEKVVDKTSGENKSWQNNYIGDREVKYIRVVGTKCSVHYYFHVVELKAYYNANAPKPSSDVALSSLGAKVYNALVHPAEIIDGIETGYSISKGFTSAVSGWKQPIIIELDKVYKLNQIDLLLWDLDNRYYQYFIEVSKDNRNWEKIVDKTTGEHKSWQNIHFDEREIKYIRVVGTYGSANNVFHIVELKAYYNGIIEKPSSDVALASKGAKVYNGKYTSKMIDGIKTGYTYSSGFAQSIFTAKEPLIVELDQVYNINQININLWDLDNRYYNYFIDISKDNKSWERVIDQTSGEHRGLQNHQIGDKDVKYIRVVGTNNSAGGYTFDVVELEALSK